MGLNMNLYNWKKPIYTIYKVNFWEKKKIVLVIDEERISYIFAKKIRQHLKNCRGIINYKKIDMRKEDSIYFVVSSNQLEKICSHLRKIMREGIDFFSYPFFFINRDIFRKKKEWKNIEEFKSNWEIRTKKMALLINTNIDKVIDLGCGECKLKKYISKEVIYYGVDYKKRTNDTIICDFNKYEFPQIPVNENSCYFCSGLLEYIEDLKEFLYKMGGAGQVLVSYCPIEYNQKNRRNLAWKNGMTVFELVNMFFENGFQCSKSVFVNNNIILSFNKVGMSEKEK